jgi:hypothetical protein
MRAPAIPPAEIGADLQPLYDDMRQGIERSFKGFVAIRQDGALVREKRALQDEMKGAEWAMASMR